MVAEVILPILFLQKNLCERNCMELLMHPIKKEIKQTNFNLLQKLNNFEFDIMMATIFLLYIH